MSAEFSSAEAVAIAAAASAGVSAASAASEGTPMDPATNLGANAEETAENGAAAIRQVAALPEASAQEASSSVVSAPIVCPVCRARFRGAETCSRCGADLGPLLLLSAHAFRLRQRARGHLRQRNFLQALACAVEAERLRSTPHGALLRVVCVSLASAK